MKKVLKILAIPAIALTLLSGCGGGGNEGPIEDIYGIVPKLDYSGELDVLCYIQGQNGRVTDIGNVTDSNELFDASLAKYHAAAKAWKEFYPNIKINVLYCNIEDYYNTMSSYLTQFGHLPHVMHLPSAPQEGLNAGYLADLSQYSYMSYYQAINPSLLNYFTFGGFVSAVPMYIYPTGIFVNLDILEKEYLITDGEDYLESWTYEKMVEYARETTESGTRAGMGYISNDIINNAAKSINYSMLNNKTIDLNTPEVRAALQLENELATYSSVDYKQGGYIMKESFNFIQSYSYNTNFINDQNYTMESSRAYCALLYSQMIEQNGDIGKFDFLPMPRLTAEDEMSIGIIAEGLTVGNQCSVAATNCTEEAKLSQEAAAAFAMFMNVDTRSYTAMSEVEWTYQNEKMVGIVESLPVIRSNFRFEYNTGEENDYYQQLEIYKNLRAAWKEQPGFNEILRIYEEEPENTYAYNTIPRQIPASDNTLEDILEDWDRRYFGDGTVTIGDTGWLGWVESNLDVWSQSATENLEQGYNLLQEALDMYYGFGNYDVENNTRNFEWEIPEEETE